MNIIHFSTTHFKNIKCILYNLFVTQAFKIKIIQTVSNNCSK